MRVKISVLASGTVLLDGQPVDGSTIDAALDRAQLVQGQVWFYREAPAASAPPQALAVIQNVVRRKLPVSLSSRPDFSDWVDAKGVSRPRAEAAATAVRIPDVASRSDIGEVFARIRQAAAEGIAILKPDRTHIAMPRLEPSGELREVAASMSRLVDGSVVRNIAVIACTAFAPGAGDAPGLAEISDAIPFLGMLVGLSYIGHAVWVFEGHATALAFGCRDADLLLVDSALCAQMGKDWEGICAASMRNANILVHRRDNLQLALVRSAAAGDGLQFPNRPRAC
ncbi:MAG: hypothetical protein ABI759_28240 [Candidatus Solibacter sp.]